MMQSALVAIWIAGSSTVVITSDNADSHVTTPGQQAFGVNVDGVALLALVWDEPSGELANLCTGALISDQHILTAAHCYDENADGQVDGTIAAFPLVAAFDLADGRLQIPITLEAIRIAPAWFETDLWADLAVLELADVAPMSVPRYPLYGGDDELGASFALTGYGSTGYGNNGIEDDNPNGLKKAGLNRYESISDEIVLEYDFDSGQPANNALQYLGIISDLGFGVDEAFSAAGDSGGPTFMDGAIVGVMSTGYSVTSSDVTRAVDSSWGEIGEDVRVSRFRSFLTQATNGMAVFVNVPGDFNDDGFLDAMDIDALSDHVRSGESNPLFDLNSSGTVDDEDRRVWIKDLKQTWYGDANLNGEFDSSDLVTVFVAGEYDDGVLTNSTWATGDWNGDGEFDTSDLVRAFDDGGYEQGLLSVGNTVPEPTLLVLLIAGLLSIANGCRRRPR